MDNHERFRKILMNVLNNQGYIVYSDNYPNYLESDIQLAVYYKRIKEYDKSIQVYLNIFEENKGVYPLVLEYLYKTVLCNGQLVFAYETILFAELFAKKCWGMKSFFGDWSQTVKRKEFENILIEYFKQPRSFVKKEGEDLSNEMTNAIFANSKKVNQMIKEIAANYSGQKDYDFPNGRSFEFEFMLKECGEIYNHFHKEYGYLLK